MSTFFVSPATLGVWILIMGSVSVCGQEVAEYEFELPPPDAELERVVLAGFRASHAGWSTDEVLLQDDRRQLFLEACIAQLRENEDQGQNQGPSEVLSLQDNQQTAELCNCLLHLRKQGGILPKATRRAPRNEKSDELVAVAEIAARSVQEKFRHTDSLLIFEQARADFASIVQRFLPDADLYLARKAALSLRKARRLEPELVSRITDWKKVIYRYEIGELQDDLGQVPKRPGIYLFMDDSGYLYIGQAKDLRERLANHLQDSDRKSLAKYLATDRAEQNVQIELHVFGEGSPGEQTECGEPMKVNSFAQGSQPSISHRDCAPLGRVISQGQSAFQAAKIPYQGESEFDHRKDSRSAVPAGLFNRPCSGLSAISGLGMDRV